MTGSCIHLIHIIPVISIVIVVVRFSQIGEAIRSVRPGFAKGDAEPGKDGAAEDEQDDTAKNKAAVDAIEDAEQRPAGAAERRDVEAEAAAFAKVPAEYAGADQGEQEEVVVALRDRRWRGEAGNDGIKAAVNAASVVAALEGGGDAGVDDVLQAVCAEDVIQPAPRLDAQAVVAMGDEDKQSVVFAGIAQLPAGKEGLDV